MHSEGFLFLSGGAGGRTVFVPISGLRPRTTANDRERPFCARYAVPLGLASRGVAWSKLCGAVPLRLLGRAWSGWHRAVVIGRGWSGWRCAVVIAGERLVWVAPCRYDRWGEPGLGGVMPL